ncbi:hypothetical protein [Stetteria hydrogenophila]
MGFESTRRDRLAALSAGLAVAASALMLFASILASTAQAYVAGLLKLLAGSVEGLGNATIAVAARGGSEALSPAAAALALRRYASATGLSALAAALTGVLLPAAALAARSGRGRGLHRFLLAWGLLVALMEAALARSSPAYSGPYLAPLAALAGGLLVAAAGALPGRLARQAAAVALAGGLLVAAGVYMGAYPLDASTAGLSWLTSVNLGVKETIGARGLRALTDPAFAAKGLAAPRLEEAAARLGSLEKLMAEGRASGDTVKSALEGVAETLRGVAEYLPDPLASKALSLASMAGELADRGASPGDVEALRSGVAELAGEVGELKLNSRGVAAGLEAVQLLHPVVLALASTLGAAAAFTRGSRRAALAALAVAAASLAAAYVYASTLTGPARLAGEYIGLMGRRSLEVRTYPHWKAAATAAGLVSASLWAALAASALAAAGGLLYAAARLPASRRG